MMKDVDKTKTIQQRSSFFIARNYLWDPCWISFVFLLAVLLLILILSCFLSLSTHSLKEGVVVL